MSTHDPTAAAEHVSGVAGSPWWAEHRARYHLANRHLGAGTVIDVACGSGLGASIIANNRDVIGFDLDPGAVEESMRNALDLRYYVCRADATRLPLASGSVDAVVSFETIEHVPEASHLVRELRRVIKDRGVLILSTPNALVTRPVDGVPANPYHVREFTPDELGEILHEHFSDVELLGQTPSESYGVSPFWSRREDRPRDLRGRIQVVIWKILARTPSRFREWMSHLLWRRPFYPGEHDFDFTAEALGSAHALVAVCRP